MTIDWRYKINAVNPCSGNTHDENDSILLLAKDKAVPMALLSYRDESLRLGANLAYIHSIDLLIERVDEYQRKIESKVPDTDLPCEIARCVAGIYAAGVMPAEQDEMRTAALRLSPWLAAALDDPNVCQQYKDAINAWFNTGMPQCTPPPSDDARQASFESAARPLIEWMAKNCHPHTTTIVTATHAELLEGQMVVSTNEYLVD
jgi:hypothetical protein